MITSFTNVSASGLTTLLPAVTGVNYRIHSILLSGSTAVNITFETTGGTALTGTFQNVLTFSFDFSGALHTGLGLGFAINLSAASNIGVSVTYETVTTAL